MSRAKKGLWHSCQAFRHSSLFPLFFLSFPFFLLSRSSFLFPYSWNKTNERWCRGDHSLNHRKKEKLILLTVIKVCTFVSCDFLCEGFLLSRESSSSFLFLLLIDCHFLSLPHVSFSLSLSLSDYCTAPKSDHTLFVPMKIQALLPPTK